MLVVCVFVRVKSAYTAVAYQYVMWVISTFWDMPGAPTSIQTEYLFWLLLVYVTWYDASKQKSSILTIVSRWISKFLV